MASIESGVREQVIGVAVLRPIGMGIRPGAWPILGVLLATACVVDVPGPGDGVFLCESHDDCAHGYYCDGYKCQKDGQGEEGDCSEAGCPDGNVCVLFSDGHAECQTACSGVFDCGQDTACVPSKGFENNTQTTVSACKSCGVCPSSEQCYLDNQPDYYDTMRVACHGDVACGSDADCPGADELCVLRTATEGVCMPACGTGCGDPRLSACAEVRARDLSSTRMVCVPCVPECSGDGLACVAPATAIEELDSSGPWCDCDNELCQSDLGTQNAGCVAGTCRATDLITIEGTIGLPSCSCDADIVVGINTTLPPTVSTYKDASITCDTSGVGFGFSGVVPGDYFISAVIDLNGNGTYDDGEPVGTYPDDGSGPYLRTFSTNESGIYFDILCNPYTPCPNGDECATNEACDVRDSYCYSTCTGSPSVCDYSDVCVFRETRTSTATQGEAVCLPDPCNSECNGNCTVTPVSGNGVCVDQTHGYPNGFCASSDGCPNPSGETCAWAWWNEPAGECFASCDPLSNPCGSGEMCAPTYDPSTGAQAWYCVPEPSCSPVCASGTVCAYVDAPRFRRTDCVQGCRQHADCPLDGGNSQYCVVDPDVSRNPSVAALGTCKPAIASCVAPDVLSSWCEFPCDVSNPSYVNVCALPGGTACEAALCGSGQACVLDPGSGTHVCKSWCGDTQPCFKDEECTWALQWDWIGEEPFGPRHTQYATVCLPGGQRYAPDAFQSLGASFRKTYFHDDISQDGWRDPMGIWGGTGPHPDYMVASRTGASNEYLLVQWPDSNEVFDLDRSTSSAQVWCGLDSISRGHIGAGEWTGTERATRLLFECPGNWASSSYCQVSSQTPYLSSYRLNSINAEICYTDGQLEVLGSTSEMRFGYPLGALDDGMLAAVAEYYGENENWQSIKVAALVDDTSWADLRRDYQVWAPRELPLDPAYQAMEIAVSADLVAWASWGQSSRQWRVEAAPLGEFFKATDPGTYIDVFLATETPSGLGLRDLVVHANWIAWVEDVSGGQEVHYRSVDLNDVVNGSSVEHTIPVAYGDDGSGVSRTRVSLDFDFMAWNDGSTLWVRELLDGVDGSMAPNTPDIPFAYQNGVIGHPVLFYDPWSPGKQSMWGYSDAGTLEDVELDLFTGYYEAFDGRTLADLAADGWLWSVQGGGSVAITTAPVDSAAHGQVLYVDIPATADCAQIWTPSLQHLALRMGSGVGATLRQGASSYLVTMEVLFAGSGSTPDQLVLAKGHSNNDAGTIGSFFVFANANEVAVGSLSAPQHVSPTVVDTWYRIEINVNTSRFTAAGYQDATWLGSATADFFPTAFGQTPGGEAMEGRFLFGSVGVCGATTTQGSVYIDNVQVTPGP